MFLIDLKISTAIQLLQFVLQGKRNANKAKELLINTTDCFCLKNELPLGPRKGIRRVLAHILCTGQLAISNRVIHIKSRMFFSKGKAHHLNNLQSHCR